MPKRIRKPLLAVLLLVGSLFWASPAQAHSVCSHHFYDIACVSGSNPYHYSVKVCDREADWNRVWVYVVTYDGRDHWRYDQNGYQDPCYDYGFTSPIYYFAVYEDGVGGGDWVYA